MDLFLGNVLTSMLYGRGDLDVVAGGLELDVVRAGFFYCFWGGYATRPVASRVATRPTASRALVSC